MGWVAIAAALALSGCEQFAKTSTITGRVVDLDGQPVRDARVFTVDGETRTGINGQFVLGLNREGDLSVTAEATRGSVTFRGRNVVRTVSDQQQHSVVVTVFPTSQLARIRGLVRDNFNQPISGARVFAFAPDYLTSAVAVTGSDGRYELLDLSSGLGYTVQAGAPGFANDTFNLSPLLTPGENRTANFFLDPRGTPSLPQPTGLVATTWASPRNVVRSGSNASAAYENIKRRWSPERASRPTPRGTTLGNSIEVELEWNRLVGDDFYGYGIYRGFGSGFIGDYDFYREPLAGIYIDGDTGLLPNQLYRYQITALGTGFPNSVGSEGPRSAIVEARTLDDLSVSVASLSPLRFTWNTNSGATSYVVYLFDQFPGVGVDSVFNLESSPVSGSSYTYDRVANPGGLVPGRTYHVLVLGLANSNRSRTLSNLTTFTY